MSRAFVKDQDDAPEELAERPISQHPNLVTSRGLAAIDAEMDSLRQRIAEAHAADDKQAAAWLNRDLRYWVQRRSSAQLTHHPEDLGHVAFATRVTIGRDDGRQQVFAIVGEDEADPAHGLIAYVSPMAHALMNRKVGEWAEVPGGEAEILRIEALQD
jgi:transcription elongation GreA/GreB family factor